MMRDRVVVLWTVLSRGAGMGQTEGDSTPAHGQLTSIPLRISLAQAEREWTVAGLCPGLTVARRSDAVCSCPTPTHET